MTTVWVPVLICTHATLCTGAPIKGPAQPTYIACQMAISRALDNYARQAHEIGVPELASYEFTRRYVRKSCEQSDAR